MRTRFLILMVCVALLTLLLVSCSLGRGEVSRLTATPTKTLRPVFTSTATPTATALPTYTPIPTETPVPPTDTSAPTEPPLPTESPIPPTEAPPTNTPIPPTDTPAPPTNTPKPRSTNTPVPPANTPKPQVDFRVVEQRLMSKAENEAQRHQIMIRVTNAAGNPLSGVVVWDPNHPDQEAVSGTKPEPYHAEYLFWDYEAYQLEVKGASSEKTKVLSTDVHKILKEDLITAGYCTDVASCNPDELVQHFSWFVTFQRTH